MKSSHFNRSIFFYLPLGGVLTLCLALLLQMIVSVEFGLSEIESAASDIEFVDSPNAVMSQIEQPIDLPLRELYEALPHPPRLEPDKTCEARLVKRPKVEIRGVFPTIDYYRALDSKGAARRERPRKENAEKEKRERQCPLLLIPNPTPHNPARRHTPAPSL
jgi:hypothetical protein